MYPSRGGNSYSQQQSYAAQSSYGQNPTSAYAGSSGGPDGSSQLNPASRHPSALGGRYEADIGGYRAHTSAANLGGQYSSLYGSASLGTAQQVMTAKASGPSTLEGRGLYMSSRKESPKYPSADYVGPSSHGYGHNAERLLAEKIPEYASVERRQYGERQSAYIGRDLPSETAGRYADSVSFAHHHQANMFDRIDQSVLRQEQMLKTQSLQSASHDGVIRQADYLAARSGTLRQITQELDPYGGRADADPRALSLAGGRSSLAGQNAPSILGAAPQRSVEDLIYAQTSSNPGYGVSLPPGRDYGIKKALHDSTLELEYARGLHPRIDDLKVERGGYTHQLELREEERQKERLREREKERERERERDKDRERERQRERERERERDRERERERERERDRERERKRALELREERERERKRALEIRRERTPPRLSKDRHTSVTKDGKSTHRDSPRREALHRLHSPVKERKRDYVCKVHTSSLVVQERDYLSLDKRYPRLYISPDFCKLIVNWPRGELKLSVHTPVSFEHDFIEEDDGTEKKEESMKLVDMENVANQSIVWNAKMILMSGLSRSALEELSSDKVRDDRMPHVCSILRFAVLRKERAFMAIGGPWDPIDGGDPAVDDSSLIRTVIRHAKDLTQLDLQNCKRWNRFLEIHYDRVGKDGLSSHKEVTVLFVPDLSDCLPSLDAWREQWLSHKKAVAEREKQLSLKKEKLRERKDSAKDKEISLKDGNRTDNSEKKKEIMVDVKEKNDDTPVIKTTDHDQEGTAKNGSNMAGGVEDVKKEEGDEPNQNSVKTGKKKIVRRIVKKVPVKRAAVEAEKKENDKMMEDAISIDVTSENAVQRDVTTEPCKKILVRKKIVKKVSPVELAADHSKDDEQSVSIEDKSQVKSATAGAAPVKRTVKRKIIRRVPKKKTPGAEASSRITTESTRNTANEGDTSNVGNGTGNMEGALMDEDVKAGEIPKLKDLDSEMLSAPGSAEKKGGESSGKMIEKADKALKKEEVKNGKKAAESKLVAEVGKGTISPKDNRGDMKEKSKERETSRNGKEEKEKGIKDGPKSKSSDLDRKKPEEPPRPGLIMQTTIGKDSKAVRSLSLSLDSLLDYSDKDVEESTFELSLFAESMYEMLQYQMGHRLLTFLQKLRIKFVMKRNRRKRLREEASEKKTQDKTSTKRLKGDETPGETKLTKSEEKTDSNPDGKKLEVKEEVKVEETENVKVENEEEPKVEEDEEEMEEEEEEEEDPEEYVEYEDMQDAGSEPEEEKEEDENADPDAKAELSGESDGKGVKDEPTGEAGEGNTEKRASTDGVSKPKSDADKVVEDKEDVKADASTKAAPVRKEPAVDKELLQAFRFFDRNRAGYIRVEDMRLILHTLGESLSHRDVKELAQSALLESNTGRDDRILYEKLVKMTDLR